MKREKKLNKNEHYFETIKSKYIMNQIMSKLQKKKLLEIIHYNKNIQEKIDININNYKNYSETYSKIEIEIIPLKNYKFLKFYNFYFINIPKQDKSYYHIYFNNNKEEINRNYLTKNDKVDKIKIIIDYQVTSFNNLFNSLKIIKSINFIKFSRNNITSMSDMFRGCTSLIDLNLSKLKTDIITDMSYMFYECNSLKNLDLSNFNTQNVTSMERMFQKCTSLKNLELSNFNTNKVIIMEGMFCSCASLIKLDLSNFDTQNVLNMSYMFLDCSSLVELYVNNFNMDKVKDISYMFNSCSSLKKLNLSDFNVNKFCDMTGIFYGCKSLHELNLSENFKTRLRFLIQYLDEPIHLKVSFNFHNNKEEKINNK